MDSLNRIMIRLSQKWWAVLVVFVLNLVSFGVLFSLEDQFEALSGLPTFDTQNDLTQSMLVQQLPAYTGEARSAYLRFAAFDFVFPLVAGIFLSVLWALLLRLNRWPLFQRLLHWKLALFPLLGTLWDYLENMSLLTILNTGLDVSPLWLDAAILFKQLKLTWLSSNGVVTGILLVLLLLNWGYRRIYSSVRAG
jgi:hypothetical protein